MKAFLAVSASSVLVLGLVGLGFWWMVAGHLTRELERNGQVLMGVVQGAFLQSMMHQEEDFIESLLKDLSRHEDIRGLAIYRHDGTPAHRAGFTIDLPPRGGEVPREGEAGDTPFRILRDGGDAILLVSPIANRPSCHQCHPRDRGTLGSIAIQFSPGKVAWFSAASRRWFMLALTGLTAVLLGVNLFFFRRYLAVPLAGLRHKIRLVEEGKEPVEFSHGSRDEVEELEARFGGMVERLREHHRRELAREREMVVLAKELEHREEMTEANLRLSQQVEELDRANRRVTTLAARLEEKNADLERMIKRVSALNRLGAALASELEMARLHRQVVNVAVKGLKAEYGFLMIQGDGGGLRIAYGVGLGMEYDRHLPVEVGESISGHVARSGEPLLVDTFGESAPFRPVSRYGFQRRSVICAPLKIKDRVMGTLELTNKRGEESFDREDLEMLSAISGQAAIALDNATLYDKIQKSYFDTIRALIQAVEEKDRYTSGHSERVTLFAIKIGLRKRLDQRNLEVLKYAGYLHDIGKIGIDINILQKKGRLNAEEFDQVKNHPLIGERIIAPIEFLQDVRQCVSQHHERFDGTGYPGGHRGHEICLEARVLAVADAYDAMITHRPYRTALRREDAVAELLRCSGTHFDPDIVEVFVEVLQSDEEIRELERNLTAVGT